MAADDKKQRCSGYDLAAGCEDFSTERGHGRGEWLPRGDGVNAKNSGCFLVVATVFGELVAEGADADLEEFGGLGAVAVCALEGFEDGAFFEFVEWHDLGIRSGSRGSGFLNNWSRLGGSNGRWRGETHEFGANGHALLGEDGGAFDDILEFAHIAGPIVGEQSSYAAFRKSAAFDAVFLGKTLEKMIGEDFDIPRALAERGDLDGENIEAVVEILAKFAFLNRFEQVAVRGGKDADIDFDGFISPDAFEFPLLEDAEELGLEGEGDLTDLVEQNRAAIRQLEAAIPLVGRAGEGAFFVAEEFAFDERLGNGGAIDLDERLVGTLAVEENLVGHKLFARSIFTADHDRGIRPADTVDEIFQAGDGGAASNDLAAGDAFAIKKIRDANRALELGRLLENEVDLRHRKRLGKVIESPQPHALHDGFDRPVGSDHYHKGFVVIVGDALDEDPPVAIGQFHVEEDEIKRIGCEALFGLRNRPRRGDGIPLAPQSLLEGFANNRGVINNQYAVKSHQVLAGGR